jgi:hypothetical protein
MLAVKSVAVDNKRYSAGPLKAQHERGAYVGFATDCVQTALGRSPACSAQGLSTQLVASVKVCAGWASGILPTGSMPSCAEQCFNTSVESALHVQPAAHASNSG